MTQLYTLKEIVYLGGVGTTFRANNSLSQQYTITQFRPDTIEFCSSYNHKKHWTKHSDLRIDRIWKVLEWSK